MAVKKEGIAVKKVLTMILAVIVMLGGVYFIGSGFTVRNDVVLYDFDVSEDGSSVTLNVGVSSSAGYIRDLKDISDEEEKIVLKFYSAFGGINGKIGSKNSFGISVTEESKEIYFADELLLKKNEITGQWERVKDN